VTASHDHAHPPATGHELGGASHRAGAGEACADEHARAARSVDCECQARAGAACGPAGDHLARYLHAHQAGALTRDSLTHVIAQLDVIAPRALIQPPSECAAPTRAAKDSGRAARGQASAGVNADRSAGLAQSALALDREAPGRNDRGALAVHPREEPEREAGS
jgi:hypothetical protein